MKNPISFSILIVLVLFNYNCDSNDFHEDLNDLGFRIKGHSTTSNTNIVSCEFYNLDVENRNIDLYVYPRTRDKLDLINHKYSLKVENIEEEFVLNDLASEVEYSCILSYENENEIIETEEYNFSSTLNDSAWELYKNVESHSDDYHQLFSGNGTLYYFSGDIPLKRFKLNLTTKEFEEIYLPFHFYFFTYKDKPYFLNKNSSGQLKTIDENNESVTVAILDSQPRPLEVDFNFEFNDKIYFNTNEKLFEMDFNSNYAIKRVGTIPIDHFDELDQYYTYQKDNLIYFLVPENSGGSIYSMNLIDFEWKFETKYPGEGTNYFWFTGEGNTLFVGGGAIDEYEYIESRFTYKKGDFWSYDLSSGNWKLRGYIPYESKFVSTDVVQFDGKHFHLSSLVLPLYNLTSFDFSELD